eukprot:TRINITY_DN8823_c0_g1_i1.p1 TRINITY_DN8823_c0_g1~~TRINITY_DN8823_c0_g1_i1.p1  ORF type:complete len:349 (+),score=71.83 TRINITY_DN8823_c0_g1_i1:149-1195(+)
MSHEDVVERGRYFTSKELPALIKGAIQCAMNPYSEDNVEGLINVGTAENSLMWPEIKEKLANSRDINLQTTKYDAGSGRFGFKQALSPFMNETFGVGTSVDSIAVASGSSALLEILFYCLCNKDEGVLVPSPYYGGFDFDLPARAGVKVVPVPTTFENNWRCTTESLQAAYDQAEKAGIKIKALIVTSPHNPVGTVLGDEECKIIVDFCTARNLHVVEDAIYAKSILGDTPYRSLWHRGFIEKEWRDRYCHLIYGFAKDFGMGGFKVGLFHSLNPAVMNAVASFCHFHTVSNDTQDALMKMISDSEYMANYWKTYQNRLQDPFKKTIVFLEESGIPFSMPDAGFFCLV